MTEGAVAWLARVAGSGCVYVPKPMGAFKARLARKGGLIEVRLEPCPEARPGRIYLFSRREMRALGWPGRELTLSLSWEGDCLRGTIKLKQRQRRPAKPGRA